MDTKITLSALTLATIMATLPAADAQAQNSRAILENSGKVEVQKRTSRNQKPKLIPAPGDLGKAKLKGLAKEKSTAKAVLRPDLIP